MGTMPMAMSALTFHQSRKAFLSLSCVCLVSRRHRYKPKWAVQLKSRSNCQKALDHFDAFYKPVIGELWSSVRLPLLSLPKHCAVINKFTDVDKVTSKLEVLGCLDILQPFKGDNIYIKPSASGSSNYSNTSHYDYLSDDVKSEADESASQSVSGDSKMDSEHTSEYELMKKKGPSELKYVVSADSLEPFDEETYKDNLDAFVPPDKVLSQKDLLVEEEIQAISFQPSDVDVDVIPMEPIRIPEELRVLTFPSGVVSRFPQPKAYNQRTGYYLMDAGSILPVLAMNLQSSDRVLDLCAAPGGKSLAMLQTLDFTDGAQLHCNDISGGRIVRLKNIFSSYLPTKISQQINLSQMDGLAFQALEFDKVLVDAPCNSDRHVVTEEDNNLFRQSRTRERLGLMQLQTKLLISAIKLCRVGGTIVYSTCTMAPAQNDGVIQAAVQKLSETSKIKVAVEDLSPLSSALKENFNFFGRCRFGQLILPSLTQNFGPSYFAKLRRIH